MRPQTPTWSQNLSLMLMLLAVALMLFAVAVQGWRRLLDLPDVQVSESTGRCVRVIDYAAQERGEQSRFDCSHLPERYTRVRTR